MDACEYSEDDEQVDIETVEELSEKINIARLKATAANIRPSKENRILQFGAEGRSLRKKLLLITARHTQQMNAGDVMK